MAKQEQTTIERVTVAVPEKLFASPAEISLLYGFSESYLKKLRHLRQGPPYRKCGRMVLYPMGDFARWFETATVPHEPDPSL